MRHAFTYRKTTAYPPIPTVRKVIEQTTTSPFTSVIMETCVMARSLHPIIERVTEA